MRVRQVDKESRVYKKMWNKDEIRERCQMEIGRAKEIGST